MDCIAYGGLSVLCVAESLCCLPETIPTLLIGYNPIQNVFGVLFVF